MWVFLAGIWFSFQSKHSTKRKRINEIVTATLSFASIYQAMGSGIRVVSNTCLLYRNVGLFGGNLSLVRVIPQYEKKPTVCFQLKTLLSKSINEIVSATLSLASIYEAISSGANIELQPFWKETHTTSKETYVLHTTHHSYALHTTHHSPSPYKAMGSGVGMASNLSFEWECGLLLRKCGSLLRECGYVLYATPHSPLSTRPWVVASE